MSSPLLMVFNFISSYIHFSGFSFVCGRGFLHQIVGGLTDLVSPYLHSTHAGYFSFPLSYGESFFLIAW